MAKNIWRGRPMDEVRQSSVAGAQRRAPAHIERGFREADSRSQRDFLAPRNRRKYRNRIPVFQLRIEFLLVPDIVLVHEHVDKSLHGFAVIEDPVSETLELRIHFLKDFSHGGALDLHLGLAGRQRSQRRWNFYGDDAHFDSPSSGTVTRGSS